MTSTVPTWPRADTSCTTAARRSTTRGPRSSGSSTPSPATTTRRPSTPSPTKGIIEGYNESDNLKPTYFGTFDAVTRQQYAKMILLTMAAWDPVVYSASFHDTLTFADAADIERKEGELYPYYYIAKAARTGLTFGYPDGTFRPAGNITRQQVISMIVRAARDNFTEPPANWEGVSQLCRSGAW